MDSKNLIKSIRIAIRSLYQGDQDIQQKIIKIDQIIRYTVSHLSDKENLFFASYYAKVSFLCTKYKISPRNQFLFHSFRKFASDKRSLKKDHVDLGVYVLNNLTKKCLDDSIYENDLTNAISHFFNFQQNNSKTEFKPYEVAFLKAFDEEKEMFILENSQGLEFQIGLQNDEDAKELQTYLIKLGEWNRLPIKVALFNIRKNENGITVSHYVIEPDFLIDVTSVSEAFDAFGISVAGYGLKKMIDKGASISLHIGNLANVILDELIYDPTISFNHFKNKIFRISPMAFASFTNEQVKQLVETTNNHYRNIKKIVNKDFQNQGINGNSVFVEPSFYAPRIGIQGRFDLLHDTKDVMNIIELKSGKTYRPNTYGLNNSHYHQTLLYDLILETNFGKSTKRNNFILYSAESENGLRYAPTIRSEQTEALRVRNRIFIEECKMQCYEPDSSFIKDFLGEYDGKLSGFKGQDLKDVQKIYGSLSAAEKAYWETSFSFLSREYSLSKIGDELVESSKGLSAIWQLDQSQKHERFLLLNDLNISINNSQEDDPHLLLEFTEDTNLLSNFRIGDIIILYPSHALSDNRLRSQIFKCTLSEIKKDHVIVRLRSKQMNHKAFDSNKRWNIEHDILDSSFSKSFRQLYHFAKGEKEKRSLILGARPPKEYEDIVIEKHPSTTNAQHEIVKKAIASEEYHLIWGPPGTGKTSIILKEIISRYYSKTQLRLLIIGYTNRAVDEICNALEGIDKDLEYIRIGSKYSCGDAYKSKLLNAHLNSVNDRKSLKQLLNNTQIYIGTLASIIGKPELFDLLQFGVCIVDEASQILEASLAGLLTKTKKFILIGDHLQLPAIVLQKSHQSAIENENLNVLGFRSYGESLFERLYRRCIDQNWYWAYSQLTEQGRMHTEIMNIVNDLFYQGRLKELPINKKVEKSQKRTTYSNEKLDSRVTFIPTPVNDEVSSKKVNHYEAKAIVKVINELTLGRNYSDIEIGIITPFRAQIAMIKSEFEAKKIDYSKITIDTVERYQGGARDIIIMSTAVNTPFQMDALVSKNVDGIDRKLNVAISRARELFILVGNEEVLSYSDQYVELIKRSSIKQLNH